MLCATRHCVTFVIMAATGQNFKIQIYLRHRYLKLFKADCRVVRPCVGPRDGQAERMRQIISIQLKKIK